LQTLGVRIPALIFGGVASPDVWNASLQTLGVRKPALIYERAAVGTTRESLHVERIDIPRAATP
jgi:hypothetical protein